jgi:hypothetical protein
MIHTPKQIAPHKKNVDGPSTCSGPKTSPSASSPVRYALLTLNRAHSQIKFVHASTVTSLTSPHLGLVASGKALVRPPLISALLCMRNFQVADALAVVFQHPGNSKVERLCWVSGRRHGRNPRRPHVSCARGGGCEDKTDPAATTVLG